MDVGIIWVLDLITNINNNINISRSSYYQSLTRYLESWAITWVHFDIWGTCYHLDHTHIGAICNAKYNDIQAWVVAKDQVWIHGPIAA